MPITQTLHTSPRCNLPHQLPIMLAKACTINACSKFPSQPTNFFILSLLLASSSLLICAVKDTIRVADTFSYATNDNLTSAGKKFVLGFFSRSPGRFYLGIWYLMDPKTVVWVANRNKPLPDHGVGVLALSEDGNLELLDNKNEAYFSTSKDLEGVEPAGRTAMLLDSGNLVLRDEESGSFVWQSFKYPTDTFLPGMKMSEGMKLTSWTSVNDPKIGKFTFQQDEDEDEDEDEERENNYSILEGDIRLHWKTGQTDSSKFFNPVAQLLHNFSEYVTKTKDGSCYNSKLNYSCLNENVSWKNRRLVMNSSGAIEFYSYQSQWDLIWSEPRDNCSVYRACGSFGRCNISRNRIEMCSCLPGFEPKLPETWNAMNFSGGCKRTSTLCEEEQGDEILVNFTKIRVSKPDSRIYVESEEKCREACRDCDCQAYSYSDANKSRVEDEGRTSSHSCRTWSTDLYNLEEDSLDGHNLSVRVVEGINPAQIQIFPNKKSTWSLDLVVTLAIVVAVVLVLCSIGYMFFKRMVIRRQEGRGSTQGIPMPPLYDSDTRVKDLIDSGQFIEDNKGIDVPFFDFESVLAATDSFSDAKKLGQGGFGPVYKAMFPGGQEIAVKRLSSHSGQGLEEFKNEIVLIAKLQHRNLVRLLGYCIKGEEKILLYEYMPNKSLDAFIFDRTLCLLLNWEKRFEIIMGIARGLLYLHQDSRLRIIHRDLKTSNILLDEEMNPRISDFGLARIVGGKETEASTNRVVGTYGYMSPEYALDGLFSIKSDVFSFGVVILEIISGKKNTGFYQSQQALNLLGYAWRLWREEKALDLIDQMLLQSCNRSEVLKCIIIGLLCVQEDPDDRPTMPNVVFMLNNEISTLPNPKQPAFVVRKCLSDAPSSSSTARPELTVSMEDGR